MKNYTEREERQRKACGQISKGIKKLRKKNKRTDEQEIQLKNTQRNLREGD